MSTTLRNMFASFVSLIVDCVNRIVLYYLQQQCLHVTDLRGGRERTQSTGPPQPVMQARVSQPRPRLQAARLRPVSSLPSAVAEPSAAARWAWYTPYTTLGPGRSGRWMRA